MKRTLVVYYSNTGSNQYLAEKIAKELDADIEAIRPRLNIFFFLLLSSLIRLSWGNRKLKHDVSRYGQVILCGPIWMGQVISPLRNFIRKYRSKIKRLYLATCCGSKDEAKDDTFGYNRVFQKYKKLTGKPLVKCEAFPISLVLTAEQKKDDQAIMNTRLNDQNFKGQIQKRLDGFLKDIVQAEQEALV